MTTERFEMAMYDVNMVAEAFDHDRAIARANIATVPMAMQNGYTAR
jgi:hypothetical protein